MLPVVHRTWWVLALLARPALACKGIDDRSRHEGLIRPLWPAESGLVLTSESIDIDCSEREVVFSGGDRIELCRWRSTHVYERASPGAPARVPFVVPLSNLSQWQLRFGEQPVEDGVERPKMMKLAFLGQFSF